MFNCPSSSRDGGNSFDSVHPIPLIVYMLIQMSTSFHLKSSPKKSVSDIFLPFSDCVANEHHFLGLDSV